MMCAYYAHGATYQIKRRRGSHAKQVNLCITVTNRIILNRKFSNRILQTAKHAGMCYSLVKEIH